jgi:hypothetical protein
MIKKVGLSEKKEREAAGAQREKLSKATATHSKAREGRILTRDYTVRFVSRIPQNLCKDQIFGSSSIVKQIWSHLLY